MNRHFGRHLAVLGILALFAAAPVAAQDSTGYHVTQRYTVGGDGGWDYLTVDTDAHRLYVSRGTHVQVINLDNGTLAGDILNTPGVHGIAVAPSLNRGFTSNGRDSSVTIFDLRTLAMIGNVKVTGANPDAIVLDPVSNRVFTMNGRSASATAIDAAMGTVEGTVILNGRPEFAVADGRGRIYVNIEDSSAVVAFNARTLQVEARWSLAPCEEPSGLAIDRQHRRLFSVCGNGMMAISNADTGRLITTVPIGRGVDGAGFDPGSQNAFASAGGDGVLSIVHEDSPDHYTLLGNAPTQRGARTMTVDERAHHIYLSTAEFGPAPAPVAGQRPQRPPMIPGSFVVLVVER